MGAKEDPQGKQIKEAEGDLRSDKITDLKDKSLLKFTFCSGLKKLAYLTVGRCELETFY